MPSSWRARWGRRRCSTTTARKLRGLVLEDGGATSHVAIVARALGIPAVGDVANISSLVEPGDAIIVDGTHRRGAGAPAAGRRGRLCREGAAARAAAGAVSQAARRARRSPRDGVEIGLHMNAGLLLDLPHVAETGAASIGLFRTELLFMVAPRFPARRRSSIALYKSGARRGARPAGDVPHARHRRRQDPALHGAARGGEPGARLARHPHRARPAGAAALAVARAAAGRRRGARCASCSRWSRSVAEFDGAKALVDARDRRIWRGTTTRCRPTSSSASWSRCRRCCGSSTRSRERRRLPVGRLERPDAISVRGRPRQQARRDALRSAVARRCCGR